MSLTIGNIKAYVGAYYKVSPEEMVGKHRAVRISHPRFIAMKLAREFLSTCYGPVSLPWIGGHFGKDHTTVLYALRFVGARQNEDPAFRKLMNRHRKNLYKIGAGKPVAVFIPFVPSTTPRPHAPKRSASAPVPRPIPSAIVTDVDWVRGCGMGE